ncbi:MAG: hypothetical protein J0L63_09265 [Anaerolineae bacterium]|nr:hypothetical protein [Anaerolineae bacterium]
MSVRFFTSTTWKSFIGLFVAALIPLPAILPTLNGSLVINTADGIIHVHRIFAMTTLIQNGELYPRWIPWFHLGYGYPVFNYYAPLAAYSGGLLGLLGISAPLAYSLLVALAWMLGSAGVYKLAQSLLTSSTALLSAALWSYAPWYLQGVWNVGSLPQIMAAGIIPWFFFTLLQAARTPARRPIALAALLFSALLLAHQPTAVLAGLFVAPGLLLLAARYALHARRTLITRLVALLSALLIGLGVAAIFLLPMLLELPYVHIENGNDEIPAVFAASFIPLSRLFTQPAAPDLSELNPALPDALGALTALLAVLGVLALLRRRRWLLALVCATAALFLVFLLLDISTGFWLNLPLVRQLRFPGRALRVGGIFFALLGGASLLWLPRRWSTTAALLAVPLVIVAALPTIYPSRDLLDFSNLSAADFIRYEQSTYTFGSTSYNEFRPIGGQRPPFDVPGNLDEIAAHPLRLYPYQPAPEQGTITRLDDRTFRLNALQPFQLTFRQFDFPGWQAQLDGAPIEITPEPEHGLITIAVPAGEHTLVLNYAGTSVQHIAPLISLLSLALVAWLIITGRRQLATPSAESFAPRPAFALALGLITFALVNRFYIQPDTSWFRLRSPLASPAAMQTPVHQTFGDAYELLGYTLHDQSAALAERLNITLYWRALRPLDHFYKPVVQIVNPALTAAWGSHEGFFIGDAPVTHQPGYFIRDEHPLRLFDDAPPYLARLTVQLQDEATGQRLALPDGSTTLVLPASLRINGSGVSVSRLFDYRFDEKLELWCAEVVPSADTLMLRLYWHVLMPLQQTGIQTFVHGLDAAGELIAQGDGTPLQGEYALADWLPGQTLLDTYTLPASGEITQIAVGLFTPDGQRLPITSRAQPLPDSRLLLPIASPHCAP